MEDGNMSEEELERITHEFEKSFKIAFLKNDITQKEIAKQLHTTQQQIGKAIRGDMAPNSRKLREQMAEILHIEK